jgi:leucyl aminopeptidase (aminopeptidase T)
LTGKIIEDEKKLGTLHLGFGMNIDFGGKNESKTHNDFLVLNPTLEIDGKTLLKSGVFQIEIE